MKNGFLLLLALLFVGLPLTLQAQQVRKEVLFNDGWKFMKGDAVNAEVAGFDDKYWRNRSWADLELSQPPSYYWRNNNSCTFILDKSGIDLRERLGVHTMMWSSDYPHHGNDWPYSRRVIEEMMGNIPADERAAITGGNAARVFGLDD